MPSTSPAHRQDPPVAREAESLHLTLLDRMGMACVALDREFRVLYCNPAYTSLVGLTLTELLGQTLPLVLPEFNGSPGHQACLRAMQMQLPQEIEQTVDQRFFQYRAYLIPQGVLVVIDDVTPRRQLEEDLVLSVLRSRLMLEQVPAVHWIVDQDLRFTLSMGAGLRDINLRPGQVIGKTLYEFFDTNDPEHPQIRLHRQALEGRRITYTADFGGRTYDCVLEPLRDHDRQIVGVIGLAYDITEHKRADEERLQLQRQIFRTQKLESLGLLASGVAHDFNNLLVGILGTAEVLLRDLPDDAPQRSLVELLKKAGENAAELIRQMFVYAGKSPSSPKRLDLNALIRESQPLVSAAVRKSITLETHFAPELPILHGDASQIQQVILNLVLNAADATRRKGGAITIRTGTQLIDPPLAESEGDLAPGPYVFFEVTDDGCGMSPEVLARIFDPFFTTKAAGRGLGMSVVQGIVRTHRGGIQVRSVLGEGTTFRVLIPVEASPAQGSAEARQAPRRLVLVIDDELYVRDITTRALQGAGMGTLAAAHGKEGIELFQQHRDEIVLVLLDLILPVGPTLEAITALRQMKPEVKVILTSGHDPDEAMRLSNEWGVTGYLQKPYTLDELFEKVRTMIGG